MKGIFINGEYKITEKQYDLVHPHTNKVFEQIAEGFETDMEEAIASAHEAFQIMRKLPAVKRADILKEAARIMMERKEELAQAITLEAGKPIVAARGEVDRSVQTLLFSAEEAKQSRGEYIGLDAAIGGEGRDAYTIYEPLGVIGAITPFNFPLNLTVHKVGPAIATGNTIIVKPAEKTPLSACLFAEICYDAGLPKGAFNVVNGDGKTLGDVLLRDERVQKISFTGSPRVGKMIKEKSGLKKTTLELGSNSALYIDESMKDELDSVVEKSVIASFSYNGQVCIHTQRIYVHETIQKEFIEKFIEKTKQLQFGDPFNEQTVLTGMIDAAAQERVLRWIDEAVVSGAELKYGGNKIETGIEPTVLVNVGKEEKVVCEEIFGPVVVIQVVESAEVALVEMNDSQYGLNAGIFTNQLKQAINMAHELEVGQVLVNDVPTLRFDHMPYGGVKSSGYGHEGVKYAMKEMTKMKMISINYL